MSRASDQIDRVVDSAAKALTALQDLAVDLDTLKDSDNPFIGDEERRTLAGYHKHARMMALKTDESLGIPRVTVRGRRMDRRRRKKAQQCRK